MRAVNPIGDRISKPTPKKPPERFFDAIATDKEAFPNLEDAAKTWASVSPRPVRRRRSSRHSGEVQ